MPKSPLSQQKKLGVFNKKARSKAGRFSKLQSKNFSFISLAKEVNTGSRASNSPVFVMRYPNRV